MIVVIIDVIFNVIYGHNKDKYIKKIIVKYVQIAIGSNRMRARMSAEDATKVSCLGYVLYIIREGLEDHYHHHRIHYDVHHLNEDHSIHGVSVHDHEIQNGVLVLMLMQILFLLVASVVTMVTISSSALKFIDKRIRIPSHCPQ